uniref:Flavin reductase n=1 Tax=Streptomyces sp. FXJ1.235 TaxID=1454112 RepID=A0A2R3ZPZ9_9ACTN|nr:flavin reductase [Streptomyces sp. FXJ1.235]
MRRGAFMNRATRAAVGDHARLEGADGMRQLMAGFPTGVGIITAFDAAARPWGMTCTSLASVALDPPTLLVCLRSGSPTLQAVLTGGEFAMNLLHERARPTAELFASGAPDRFDRVEWTAPPGASGPHLRSEAHAVANCVVARKHAHGDHVVVFAEVRDTHLDPAPAPLLYGRRQYASWPTT